MSEPAKGSLIPAWVTVNVADGPFVVAAVTSTERSQPSFGSASTETTPGPFPDAGDIISQLGNAMMFYFLE